MVSSLLSITLPFFYPLSSAHLSPFLLPLVSCSFIPSSSLHVRTTEIFPPLAALPFLSYSHSLRISTLFPKQQVAAGYVRVWVCVHVQALCVCMDGKDAGGARKKKEIWNYRRAEEWNYANESTQWQWFTVGSLTTERSGLEWVPRVTLKDSPLMIHIHIDISLSTYWFSPARMLKSCSIFVPRNWNTRLSEISEKMLFPWIKVYCPKK